MIIQKTLILLLFSILVIGCVEKKKSVPKEILELLGTETENIKGKYGSRQFEKTINITVLDKENNELNINVKYWFTYRSNSKNDFNSKGYYTGKIEEINYFPKILIRQSARNVYQKYTHEKLTQLDKNNLEFEIRKGANSVTLESDYGNKIQIEFTELMFK